MVIVDVDPSHTLGVHEMTKRATYERLKREGALELNKELVFPTVIQRIAIISSETAAGFEDFKSQLIDNNYGYCFELELFPAAVQGRNMETEFVKSLSEIELNLSSFDCIVIIRGGGSKLDLSGFDSYNISKEISKSSLPVITGIGHEIDQTITDLVSHTTLKTPTAVANFIIDYNAEFESNLLHGWQSIKQLSISGIHHSKEHLMSATKQIEYITNNYLSDCQRNLTETYDQIVSTSKHYIDNAKIELSYAYKIIKNAHPTEILKRGFSIVYQNKKVITKKSNLQTGIDVEIEFSDGKEVLKNA